jgi:hypothetical protein
VTRSRACATDALDIGVGFFAPSPGRTKPLAVGQFTVSIQTTILLAQLCDARSGAAKK